MPNFWSLSFNPSDSSQNTYRKFENPDLLKTRKNLPAWNSKQLLLDMMAKNQAIVLTGIVMTAMIVLFDAATATNDDDNDDDDFSINDVYHYYH